MIAPLLFVLLGVEATEIVHLPIFVLAIADGVESTVLPLSAIAPNATANMDHVLYPIAVHAIVDGPEKTVPKVR